MTTKEQALEGLHNLVRQAHRSNPTAEAKGVLNEYERAIRTYIEAQPKQVDVEQLELISEEFGYKQAGRFGANLCQNFTAFLTRQGYKIVEG